jgi:hypothetical protein
MAGRRYRQDAKPVDFPRLLGKIGIRRRRRLQQN